MNKLESFIKHKLDIAKVNKEEFFLGIPDKWYETKLFFCKNAHISDSYLKDEEKGNVCFKCYQKTYILPNDTTEDELKIALL